MVNFQKILEKYGIEDVPSSIKLFGDGLINTTWLVQLENKELILQQINSIVFPNPNIIASNIEKIGAYIVVGNEDYIFVRPLKNKTGKEFVYFENQYYRLYPFIKATKTIQVVQNEHQAYEAASQFAAFTTVLSDFNVNELGMVIKNFHNLSDRFQQFEISILKGNKKKVRECSKEILFLKKFKPLVKIFERMMRNPQLKLRVMHHDAKINNMLFTENDNAMFVIDLDTVMPGYFYSDFGDMVRTFLVPVTENEIDISKITINLDYFKALCQGYFEIMWDRFTEIEKEHVFYAGKFLTLMQSVRFLADYFYDNSYYKLEYESQNLDRARNQIRLLELLEEHSDAMQKIINQVVKEL